MVARAIRRGFRIGAFDDRERPAVVVEDPRQYGDSAIAYDDRSAGASPAAATTLRTYRSPRQSEPVLYAEIA